ncbi:hypothetical protein GOQ30_06370 [Flavobacterium sp. TP390]|uniref:Anti-bacteriophage protein A/HamA C-terminal domain-containing protein n=1 Tax=Flavobacterium profundi TaxID=1774945 RepID=A0A6I4IS04_9FLAO|nr:hypothetical protein [Flavobacterium profundi]MVO08786.1 hypothetical protein [Flavobacterium profundi]
MFNNNVIEISDKLCLNFINIESYSNDFIDLIEKEIALIRNGDLSKDDIVYVKKAIKKWFIKKGKDERPKIGYVAEFICHLYLRSKDYKQYFLFKNLEENGPKKGFDGLYLKDETLWLVESKSTSKYKTKHTSKIKAAYKDIKKKIESNDIKDSDPWENAKNHLENGNVRKNEKLSKLITQLSKDFMDNVSHKIDEFNIIPSSTIFMGDNFENINDSLKDELKNLCKDYGANKLNIICINKKSIDEFIKFIDIEKE